MTPFQATPAKNVVGGLVIACHPSPPHPYHPPPLIIFDEAAARNCCYDGSSSMLQPVVYPLSISLCAPCANVAAHVASAQFHRQVQAASRFLLLDLLLLRLC